MDVSKRAFNFCAGPAALPEAVLQRAQAELLDWQGKGLSVMEMSHRSEEYTAIAEKAEQDLRDLLAIPNDYKVLFLQGGASQQFAEIPLNLLPEDGVADYIDTGIWSKKSIEEASRYGRINVAGRGQGVVGVAEETFFNKMNFIEGGAMGDQRDGLVIGVGLARALGVKVGDNLTVMGQTIDGTINAIDTRVSGIFQVGMKEADDTLFQVQLSEAQILLNTKKVESITIGLDHESNWDTLAEGLQQKFPGYDALSIYVLDQVWAENGQRFLTALLNIFRLVFLGMILLAIYNSASNTVLERKRELGMLRANGEAPRDLIQLLVLEGLYLALAGAMLGILMTLVVHLLSGQGIPMPPTPGTNRLLPVKLHLESSSILVALLLGVITSTAATFLSTLQVLRLSIVQAIRAAA